jgi:hypothetical protein
MADAAGALLARNDFADLVKTAVAIEAVRIAGFNTLSAGLGGPSISSFCRSKRKNGPIS